ncbi:hypothetical protein HWI79_901 [Cryptosporidium felis]|nr:hypothetical protein HWI79_901 [Cryptosporidium felis]
MKETSQTSGRKRGKFDSPVNYSMDNAANNSNDPIYSLGKSNSKFEEYYKLQEICPEGKLRDLLDSLSTPLPISIRINRSHPLHLLLEFLLSSESNVFLEKTKETSEIETLRKNLSQNCICYLFAQYSRSMLKKESKLRALHSLITAQDEFGTLSSQELVSMLPVPYLEVSPGHSILDLCAAPGSKSMQILDEVLSTGDEKLGLSLEKGIIICNDLNPKRLETLSSRIFRTPSPNTIITCIDASFFPGFRPKDSGGGVFQFDRILVDSPCSGDGTLRKNQDIWMTWKPEKAIGLHKKQLSVLSRAFKLLKYGGRLVYSTCSLNPIENEAVISALLAQFPDARLIRPSILHHGNFIFSKGLECWGVYCSLGESELENSQSPLSVFKTFESIPNVPFKNKLTKTMFPTKEWGEKALFERCLRVIPYTNDTGGFFFGVIEKVHIDNKKQNSEERVRKSSLKYEEINSEVWKVVSEFYGLNKEGYLENSLNNMGGWPIQIKQHLESIKFVEKSLFLKKTNHEKTIFLVGEDISRLFRDYYVEVNIKSAGIRVFEQLKGGISGNGKCGWRINQMGASFMYLDLGFT